MKYFILTLLVITLANCNLAETDEILVVQQNILNAYLNGPTEPLFKAFHGIFEKPYEINSELGMHRYNVFLNNLNLIKEHNEQNLSWKMGLNEFADLSEEEFKQRTGSEGLEDDLKEMIKSAENEKQFLEKFDEVEEPSNLSETIYPEVDHTKFLAPVQDQSTCGMCYAFATAAAIEANCNIQRFAKGLPAITRISQQQIGECYNDNLACKGGWMQKVMAKSVASTTQVNGFYANSDYPYKAQSLTCNAAFLKTKTVQVNLNPSSPYEGCDDGYFVRGRKCTKAIYHSILSKGPVTVVYEASTLRFFSSGIIDASRYGSTVCNKTEHAIYCYKWGHARTASGEIKEYLQCRNSWGTRWGESGDFRVFYNDINRTCYLTALAAKPNTLC